MSVAAPAPTWERSLAEEIALLPLDLREAALVRLAPTEADAEALRWNWGFWGRPKQFAPPGRWRIWLLKTGRGWGKDRTAAEWVRQKTEDGTYGLWHFVGRTAADVRDVMVEGPAGILAVSPPTFKPIYNPSLRRLTWPNGAKALTFEAVEPKVLRGPQCEAAWADEISTWPYEEAWTNLDFGLRLGTDTRIVAGTTPKPVPLLTDRRTGLLHDRRVRITTGSLYENLANLDPSFVESILGRYEGTRLAAQEIYGELVEDNPGALWRRAWIDDARAKPGDVPELRRVVVAADPAGSVEGDETGVVCAGVAKAADGKDHAWVLEDASLRGLPAKWGGEILRVAWAREADLAVAEKNYGGDMVVHVLRTVEHKGEDGAMLLRGINLKVKAIHAKKGKRVRAEPVSGLYQQGRVHHVGRFALLEDELCQWDPDESEESPNRLDALVYALSELMLGKEVPWAL